MSWVDAIASSYGLEAAPAERGSYRIRRQDHFVEIAAMPGRGDALERASWAATLLGVRLGLDRRFASYNWADERPTGRPVRNVYETPPRYGSRLQRLVPSATVEAAEAIAGVPFFTTAWGLPMSAVLYVREYAKAWHTFAEQDFAAVHFDRENLEEFGRLALFYESYKPRPIVTRTAEGWLRRYASSEGLMVSRALLFPDFDYDAAQSRGFFAVPSRDVLLAYELRPGADREAARRDFEATVRDEFVDAALPFTPRVFGLRRDGIDFPVETSDSPSLPGRVQLCDV